VKVTATTDHPLCLPKSEPIESEDVYCYCSSKKKEQQPMLEKYFKEK
jgi:hypothetical protein